MSRARHAKPRKSVLYIVALAVLALLGLLLLAGQFGLVGFRALTVQSGSMEPVIERSSVVITTSVSSPVVGDVITYRHPLEPDILITHRIVAIEQDGDQTLYITQGDANNDVDEDPVPEENVVGEVRLMIPWIGLVVSWARTDVGFIVLIIIPATIIVYQEVLNLRQQFRESRSDKPGRRIAP